MSYSIPTGFLISNPQSVKRFSDKRWLQVFAIFIKKLLTTPFSRQACGWEFFLFCVIVFWLFNAYNLPVKFLNTLLRLTKIKTHRHRPTCWCISQSSTSVRIWGCPETPTPFSTNNHPFRATLTLSHKFTKPCAEWYKLLFVLVPCSVLRKQPSTRLPKRRRLNTLLGLFSFFHVNPPIEATFL